MPSSTSSFETEVLNQPWKKNFLIAAILTVSVLASYEAMLRKKGFRPSIREDGELWTLHRERSSDEGSDSVTIIGGSRAMCAFDLDTWTSLHKSTPIQLGVPGKGFVPVLESLAADSLVRGLILCSYVPGHEFHKGLTERRKREGWPPKFSRLSPAKKLNQRIRFSLEENFSFLSSGVGLPSLFHAIGKWELQKNNFPVDRRRQEYLNVSEEELSKLRKKWKKVYEKNGRFDPAPACSEEAKGIVESFSKAVKTIESRGGRVVMIRIPTSDPVTSGEESVFPRADYWNAMVEKSNVASVHFKDFPALKVIKSCEGSHLCPNEAIQFTKRLGDPLAQALGSDASKWLGKTDSN